MKTKFKEPLESFLQKEGIKTKFVNNIMNLNTPPKEVINNVNDDATNLIDSTISGAFVFIFTPENTNFWWNIDYKWKKYIKNYKKEQL